MYNQYTQGWKENKQMPKAYVVVLYYLLLMGIVSEYIILLNQLLKLRGL